MSNVFRFKQFNVDQSGCAMKINTDGVLLGALAEADQPKTILDIGTGTGVIALMLAQRFINARIDAAEIDPVAAQTAGSNFAHSPFSERLTVYPVGFEQFFEQNSDKKYDLIISNPPFFINSLKSPKADKQLAKHAGEGFFDRLIHNIPGHLAVDGVLCLILAIDTAELVISLAEKLGLHKQNTIDIRSFENDDPHRVIIYFGFEQIPVAEEKFVIYNSPKAYSEQYKESLKNFFTIF